MPVGQLVFKNFHEDGMARVGFESAMGGLLTYPGRYSITLSAVASSAGGTVTPSAFAAFMLMTSSGIACTTRGRWASQRAPLNTRRAIA